MDFKIEILEKIDEKIWNKKLSSSPESTVYQTTNWSHLYKETFDSKPIFILIKNSNEEIVGQLLAFIHNKYFWRNINIISKYIISKLNGSIISWLYGPIIHDSSNVDDIISKILTALDEIAKKNNILMIKGSAPPNNLFNDKIFTGFNYKLKPWATYSVGLNKDPDELFAKLDKSTRYDIRKSEKEGVQFVVADSKSSFYEFAKLKLETKTKKNKKISNINKNFFDNHWEYLYKEGLEQLYLVKYHEKIIGGIFNLVFNGNVVQLGVGNLPQRGVPAGSFLTWNAIKWSINKKYFRYDMGGVSPHPQSSKEEMIKFFKSKWQGELLPYMTYTKIIKKTKYKISSVIMQPNRLHKKVLNAFS